MWELTDTFLDTFLERGLIADACCGVEMFSLGGAISDVSEEDTDYSNRAATFDMLDGVTTPEARREAFDGHTRRPADRPWLGPRSTTSARPRLRVLTSSVGRSWTSRRLRCGAIAMVGR
jgi:hypothetical protein